MEVLDYRVRHGQLPLGEAAVFAKDTAGLPLICVFALVILLFPDGRLTRRWAWVSWRCWPPSGPALAVVPLFWVAFVARQVLAWRRSAGDRRQQLKWLMAGAVLAVAGLALIAVGPSNDQISGRILRDVAFLALAALPAAIGVGILKYHRYDIDRLISRTLSYTLVTGVLIGVYAGLVLLATEVFRFRSTVAVAASTLAVAALFNPLRRRVQRSVDRRSTEPGTTPRLLRPRSRSGSKTLSTWTRSATTSPVPYTRPWNRPTYRYGSAGGADDGTCTGIRPHPGSGAHIHAPAKAAPGGGKCASDAASSLSDG